MYGGKEQTMAANALRRIAMRLLRLPPKPAGIHLELMSNADLDQWLGEHRLA
jgi:hypothetical protein